MPLDRRTFLKLAGVAAGSPFLTRLDSVLAESPGGRGMERLGVTTVSLHQWFPKTRKGKHAGLDLTLEEIPAFMVREFGVRNVEVWSRHFSDTSLEFCAKLAGIAKTEGCRIINIQLDGKDDVSAPDEAKRRASLATAKEWMDRAAACGAGSLRVNVGGASAHFDAATSIDSFSELAERGETVGVKVLVENHGGNSVNPDNVLAIVNGVDSPWCRTLPDFGNLDGKATDEKRFDVLEKLVPEAGLISAKGMAFDAGG
ncbi:MAG: TIM barrel protein, partial [Chthoniobacterales bacterium]